MKKSMIAAVAALGLLAACAGGPPVPDWQMNAKSSTDQALAAYLDGNERVEAQEFANARASMAASGQFAQVAQVELLRCAARVASVVLDECAGFAALRADATPAQQAYADYLAGHVTPAQLALLPAPQRDAWQATPEGAAAVVAGMNEPLARLVAAGVLLRSGRASPALLAVAVDTASAQGWRRPLLAWLGVQAMRARQAGDETGAQALQRRMDLVGEARP